MARLPRYTVPGVPQHVIQRGNNRTAVFTAISDCERFMRELEGAANRHGCSVHAYVLMTNHVHLLMTPTTADGIRHVMKSVGQRYAQYLNAKFDSTGPRWDGRYRAMVIDSDRYLFTCYRYIEQNPVRAGMVRDPADYRWSSYHANALGRANPLITPHERYLAIAPDEEARTNAYRALLAAGLDAPTLATVRRAVHREWALGTEQFRAEIARISRRRAAPLRRGGRRF